jgi:hypothetical protein
MATQLLIDTDVLIDYLRGSPDAVSYVEAQQERLLISVVTVAAGAGCHPICTPCATATGRNPAS